MLTHSMKEESGKTVGDKRGVSSKANKKVFALLLKAVSPTPSNIGSAISFPKDTDRGIKVLQTVRFFSEEVYKCTDVLTAPHVTHTGTYGPGRAP